MGHLYHGYVKYPEGTSKKQLYTLWLFNIAMENGSFLDDLWWFTY